MHMGGKACPPKIEMKESIILITILFLAGCAATRYDEGLSQLDKKNYNAAIEAFEAALQEAPDNAKIKRDLGYAYYKLNQLDKATSMLEEAQKQMPNDGRTAFYLGLAYEAQNKYDEAIRAYRNYMATSKFSRIRRQIRDRIKILIEKRMTELARQALANEANIDVAEIPENTVAVMYFKNLSEDAKLNPLQKGLTDMLIVDLSKAKSLRIVERVRLQKLLEEMKLGTTGLIDEGTAPRMGRLLGASRIVVGSFAGLADEQLRIDAAYTTTTTGDTTSAAEIAGDLERFFQLEKELAFGILDKMGIALTPEEKDAIQKIPTQNLMAFLAFSKGLDHFDQGQYEEAAQEFQNAVELDPNFTEAQDSFQEVQEVSQSTEQTTQELETAVIQEEESVIEDTQQDRLESLDTSLTKDFIDQPDTADTASSEEETTEGGAGTDTSTKVPLTYTVNWGP